MLMEKPPAEYWRVNSYGYPNPFSEETKALEAWDTFLSFVGETSYRKLKEYWSSTEAPRKLSAHAVESWKATFEEFGLLYVISRSDQITITPAGRQIIEAVGRKDEREFGWIGLTLLFRYPLRGIRRPRHGRHADSNILLYWCLYAALCELKGYVWWTEYERILSTIFLFDEAKEPSGIYRSLEVERLGRMRFRWEWMILAEECITR